MYAVPSVYASLILPDAQGLSRSCFLPCARDALTLHDSLTRRALTSVNRGLVFGDQFCVTVDCNEFGEFGPCVTFTVFPHHPSDHPGEDVMYDILKECVAIALLASDADFVEWLEPDQLLDVAEFEAIWAEDRPVRKKTRRALVAEAEHVFAENIKAQASMNDDAAGMHERGDQAQQARPKSASSFQRAEDLFMSLRDQIMAEDPAQLRLKAASWGMTGVLATMAPPVGAAVAVINAGKGTDLRLSAHALAVTGTLTVLHGAGLLALPFI